MRILSNITACSVVILAALGVATASAGEQAFYSFQGRSGGAEPGGGLVTDGSGNLYGTTVRGGNYNCSGSCGIVFRLGPDGSETVLYTFPGGDAGGNPANPLTIDDGGNLYGTTKAYGPDDYGTIFKVAPDGSETTLYTFTDTDLGIAPAGNLIMDGTGNLFGVTVTGGKNPACCGVIFELETDGTLDALYTFKGGEDGRDAQNLTADGSGNLYGVTLEGGGYTACESDFRGCGTVFKYSSGSGETVLHAFNGGSDGSNPMGAPVMDKAGNLYGTTTSGGSTGCGGYGCGTVFRIAPDGTEAVLHAFHGGDGAYPYGGVILDKAGNLYGTTNGGGVGCRHKGCGTVFRIAPNGTETTIAMLNYKAGSYPTQSLLEGPHGTLYGTAVHGGAYGHGSVFSVKK